MQFWLKFWQDDFLQWEPENYGGQADLRIDSRNVWLPEMALMNRFKNYRVLKLDVIDGLSTLVAHCKCHDPLDYLHSHLSTC